MKKIILILFFLLIICIFSFSATILTLKDAKSLAINNSYTSMINKNNSKIVATQRNNIFRAALPSLTYAYAYKPHASAAAFQTKDANQLTLTQPIFNSNIYMGIIGALKTGSLSNNMLNSSQSTLILKVEKAYIDTLSLKIKLKVMKDKIKVLNTNLKKAYEMFKMKMITKSDLLVIKYQLASAKVELLSAENGFEVSKLELKNILNISFTKNITLQNIVNETVNTSKINLKQDIINAMQNSNKAKTINDNYIYKKDITLGQGLSNVLPTVALVGTYSGSGETFKQATHKYSWSYGIDFSVPIFGWGKNLANLSISLKNAKNLKYTKNSELNDLKVEIESQYFKVVQLEKQENALKVQYSSAKQNYNAQQLMFKSNLITATDFMTTENNLYSSKIALETNKLNLYYAYQKYLSLID